MTRGGRPYPTPASSTSSPCAATPNVQTAANCSGWARLGHCSSPSSYQPYMRANCARACCETAQYCPALEDTNTQENCQGLMLSGYCQASSEHADYMDGNCARTCCDNAGSCASLEDVSADCDSHVRNGYCAVSSTHINFMTISCARSCCDQLAVDPCALMQNVNTQQCPDWVSSGHCESESYRSYMRANCELACCDAGVMFEAASSDDDPLSAQEYFEDASRGALDMQSTVIDWVISAQTEAEASCNGCQGTGNCGATQPPRLGCQSDVYAAILQEVAARGDVDFTDFDADGDGWVDGVTFVHSGHPASDGVDDLFGTAFNYRVWSHKYQVSGRSSDEPWVDPSTGSTVELFTAISAYRRSDSEDMLDLGVLVHEWGHMLGLEDHYTQGLTNGIGLGHWAVMSAHSGWQSGDPPAMLMPYNRIRLGWLVPTTIVGTQDPTRYSLRPLHGGGGAVFCIATGFVAGEYYLVENRQPVGPDMNMPSSGGLAIWHIDDAATTEGKRDGISWGNFPLEHYKVSLVQADGEYNLEDPTNTTNYGDAGDLWACTGDSSTQHCPYQCASCSLGVELVGYRELPHPHVGNCASQTNVADGGSCASWADLGHCDNEFASFMAGNCALACCLETYPGSERALYSSGVRIINIGPSGINMRFELVRTSSPVATRPITRAPVDPPSPSPTLRPTTATPNPSPGCGSAVTVRGASIGYADTMGVFSVVAGLLHDGRPVFRKGNDNYMYLFFDGDQWQISTDYTHTNRGYASSGATSASCPQDARGWIVYDGSTWQTTPPYNISIDCSCHEESCAHWMTGGANSRDVLINSFGCSVCALTHRCSGLSIATAPGEPCPS